MQELMQFLFEVGHLKNVDRSGWWLFGNKMPESVAERSFRCAIYRNFLAKSEGLDTFKVMMMCLFHDIHEARINDLHKIAQNYINLEDADILECAMQAREYQVQGYEAAINNSTL